MNDSLELETVEAGYGLSRVLHGVTLSARAGEVVSLLGRNGAGKSTTLKAIVGLVEVTGGAIRFDGREITRRPTHEISRVGVGYVPEDRRIFGDLTVEENLAVGAKGDGVWSEARVYQFFPKLLELAGRRAGSLSGGEQQMLTVARTLMGNPRVLLLDEPSEGLAPQIVSDVMATIRRLKESGLSIVLVEQNPTLVFDVADDVVVLNSGRVVVVSTTAELKRDGADLSQHLGVF